MRNIIKLALIWLFTIAIFAVNAQQGGDNKSLKWQRYMLPGKVLSISNDKQSAVLVFFVRANNIEAPGKVPDEMVRKIAELRDTADKIELLANARLEEARRLRTREDANELLQTIIKIENKGNELLEKSKKMRNLVSEMMCWRQREYSFAIDNQAPITTRVRLGVESVSLGDKVLIVGNSVDRLTVEHNTPGKVILLENIVEVLNKKRSNSIKIGELPGGNRDKAKKDRSSDNKEVKENKVNDHEQTRQMVEIIGTISSVNPLMVSVNGKNVAVENPAMYGYEKSTVLGFNDLKSGLSIIGQFDYQHQTNQDKLSGIYLMMGTTSMFGQDGDFNTILNTMQKMQL